MGTFVIGLVSTFVTLIAAAYIVGYPRALAKFGIASFTFAALSVLPIPIPLFDVFAPPLGMYIALVGSDYNSHHHVVKLFVVSLLLTIGIFLLLATIFP